MNFFSFCILKVTDERSRIWSWIEIRIHNSEVWIRGSGSAPKCHGSPTLVTKKKHLQNKIGVFFSRSMPTYDGGGEDDGHGVVENALPEDQHVQYWLHVQSCIHTGTMSHLWNPTKQRCRIREFL